MSICEQRWGQKEPFCKGINMPLRMMRYYSDIALAHAGEKIVQYLLYIGKAPMTMADHVSDDGWQYRYRVLDMRDQDS